MQRLRSPSLRIQGWVWRGSASFEYCHESGLTTFWPSGLFESFPPPTPTSHPPPSTHSRPTPPVTPVTNRESGFYVWFKKKRFLYCFAFLCWYVLCDWPEVVAVLTFWGLCHWQVLWLCVTGSAWHSLTWAGFLSAGRGWRWGGNANWTLTEKSTLSATLRKMTVSFNWGW